MNKTKSILVALLCSPLLLWAQGQGIQIAPYGGTIMWLGEDIHSQWTPLGGLDLGYLVHWRVLPNTRIGLRTGLGITYASSKMNATLSSQFSRVDMYGFDINYTTTSTANEQHRQLGVDLPILFSLQAHGMTLNMGSKLLWIVQDNYTQTVTDAHVSAFYPQIGVTVVDAEPTGRLQTPYTQSASGSLPKLNMLLSAELGYEWQLDNRHSRHYEHYLGVQFYADYGLWSWHQPKNEAVLSVLPPLDEGQSPQVSMGSILINASSLNYLSLGLRLYYTIQSADYSGYGWHRTRSNHQWMHSK